MEYFEMLKDAGFKTVNLVGKYHNFSLNMGMTQEKKARVIT